MMINDMKSLLDPYFTFALVLFADPDDLLKVCAPPGIKIAQMVRTKRTMGHCRAAECRDFSWGFFYSCFLCK